jgi:hypothetical protein
MQITCPGHAGLHLETRHGAILCDPWRSPAYFGSWFVFPDNSGLDWDRYGKVDYPAWRARTVLADPHGLMPSSYAQAAVGQWWLVEAAT